MSIDFPNILLDELPDLIAYLDPELRYRYTNRAYQKAMRMSAQELDGKSAFKVLPEALHEFAEAIDEGGQRLMRTLNAVIDLSNIEAMEVETRAKPLDLVQEARRGVDPFREAAQSKGLHLHVRAPRDQVVPVHLDPSALRRVFSALLDNAIKFTEQGEVVVTVEQRGAVATLSVRDTGIGIDKETRALVFDAFTQGSIGLTRTHPGCGVGLAIAQRLAERLGGTITVQSTPGQGSTFTVNFPVQELSLKSVGGKQEERRVV